MNNNFQNLNAILMNMRKHVTESGAPTEIITILHSIMRGYNCCIIVGSGPTISKWFVQRVGSIRMGLGKYCLYSAPDLYSPFNFIKVLILFLFEESKSLFSYKSEPSKLSIFYFGKYQTLKFRFLAKFEFLSKIAHIP